MTRLPSTRTRPGGASLRSTVWFSTTSTRIWMPFAAAVAVIARNSVSLPSALNLCEIHRLVAAPPLPHPLVALLRRRDMHMAVTQRSQHRDYLPDVVKAPIEELNDNVAVLGLWDTGCDARHLCAAHTGKQQADDQKPARG